MRSLGFIALALAFGLGVHGAEKEGVDERTPLVMAVPKLGFPFRVDRKIWDDPRYERLLNHPNKTAMTVRRGAVNLAFRAPAGSSDTDPTLGRLSQITDGESDGSESSIVELGPGVQWVQIDLLERCSIDWIGVWRDWQRGTAVYHGVVVQMSDNADFKAGVTTLFNNDQAGVVGQGRGTDREYVESWYPKLIDGRGVAARYVRVYSNGSTADDMNRYAEVVVLGIPGPIQRERKVVRWEDFYQAHAQPEKPLKKLEEIRLQKKVDLREALGSQRWAMVEPERWLANAEEVVLSPGLVRPEALNALPKLRRVEVEEFEFEACDLAGVERVEKLRALRVRGAGLRQDDFGRIAKLTKLEELDLRGNWLTDRDVLRLRSLKSLKKLKLDNGELSSAVFEVLEGMPELEEVSLGRWKGPGVERLKKRGVRVIE